MKEHNKIHWVKGLDITPEILVSSDNYHITERAFLGQFIAFRLYGILPDKKFGIRKWIDNNANTLYIDDLECVAITHDGYVINIQSAKVPRDREVSLKEQPGELYVVLTVNPYSLSLVDERGLHVCQEYNLVLKRIGESIECGIPLVKIVYNNNSQCWEMDENYIAPCISLSSVDALKQLFADIKEKFNAIFDKLPENDAVYMQTMMLKLELDNYGLQESPQNLVMLLKKICLVFKSYLKKAKGMEDLPTLTRFCEEMYNHNEMSGILRSGLDSLAEIDRKIGEKPVIEDELKI
jgi:hypothetical protein